MSATHWTLWIACLVTATIVWTWPPHVTWPWQPAYTPAVNPSAPKGFQHVWVADPHGRASVAFLEWDIAGTLYEPEIASFAMVNGHCHAEFEYRVINRDGSMRASGSARMQGGEIYFPVAEWAPERQSGMCYASAFRSVFADPTVDHRHGK